MTTKAHPIATVRYFQQEGRFWATFANWSGAADTLPELRTLAREAMYEVFEVPYYSRAYFEMTHMPPGSHASPKATEEFWPDGFEPSLHVRYNG